MRVTPTPGDAVNTPPVVQIDDAEVHHGSGDDAHDEEHDNDHQNTVIFHEISCPTGALLTRIVDIEKESADKKKKENPAKH